MRFNHAELVFDRLAKCDFCGKKTQVGITNYGTSNYNRLICVKCAEEIKAYDKAVFGIDYKKIIENNTDK